jgi:tripartite-type tricarboxylate transporter receptor subunit TctC
VNRTISVFALTAVLMLTVSACAGGAPAQKAEYPAKDKVITMIVPGPAGGGNDVAMRALVPDVEPLLGTTIQVVNKAGAAQQAGNTELAQAKPDGYTFGYPSVNPLIVQYLDSQRKAVYKRDSFQSVAGHVALPLMIAVRSDSPYKSVKDLIDAAKARPEEIKVGCADRLDQTHLAWLALEKMTDTKFAIVNFAGGNEQITSLLGGHVDAQCGNSINFMPNFKAGQFRILGIMDKEPNKLYPGVPTMESQGYPMQELSTRAVLAPAGTPKDIVETVSAAIKKAMETEAHKKKADDLGMSLRYMGPDELDAYWTKIEASTKELMQRALER